MIMNIYILLFCIVTLDTSTCTSCFHLQLVNTKYSISSYDCCTNNNVDFESILVITLTLIITEYDRCSVCLAPNK